jgi:endonuclease/exonuclease/phosphatase family metal-dependent hydrolase
MPSFATFNANNFFLRYRFANTFPGDTSKKSEIEATEVATIGYVPNKPFGNFGSSKFIVWDASRRELAARALAEPDGRLPDILCLQEVENLDAIRIYNQRYLGDHYPYRLLIDGHDERNIDVGVLSCCPITGIRSHVDDTDADGHRIFSRDCLEATFRLDGRETLTLFVNHLKSKLMMGDGGEDLDERKAKLRDSHARRLAQAKAVADLVEERFQGKHDRALYAVIGDFNDVAASPCRATTGPITGAGAGASPASTMSSPPRHWRSASRTRRDTAGSRISNEAASATGSSTPRASSSPSGQRGPPSRTTR